jgi:hypothetical protein
MATRIVYNSVELSYVKTNSVDAEPVYDQSGIDLLYVRHTINVEAVVAFDPARPDKPALPGETPADTMARIEHELSLPRRPFLYEVGGKPVLQSNGLDPAGGPKPTPPQIIGVTGESFIIRFQVEVCTNDCPGAHGNKPVWSSLRWTQEHSVDERNLSTITTTGRMVGNADMLRGRSLDDFRGACTPPVPNNFSRKSKYFMQADGLALDFAFTDTELELTPPSGVTSIKGTASFDYRPGSKAPWLAAIDLTLEGKVGVPKSRLMATAIAIAWDRLKKANLARQGKNKPVMIVAASFKEVLEMNKVSVQIAAMTNPPGASRHGDRPSLSGLAVGGVTAIAGAAAGLAYGALHGNVGSVLANAYLAHALAEQAEDAKEEINAARDGANRKAKRVDVPGGVIPVDLEQWGSPLLGCHGPAEAAAGIAPDLYGHFPGLRLVAAAFNDQCLHQTLDLAQQHVEATGKAKLSTADKGLEGGRSATLSSSQSFSSVVVLPSLGRLVLVPLNTIVDRYDGVYAYYHLESTYHYRSNRRVARGTVPGSPGRVVQTTTPDLYLEVRWIARKYGMPPEEPDPTPKDDNTVHVDSVTQSRSPVVMADGQTMEFSTIGIHRYEFLDPSEVDRSAPVPPFLNVKADQLPPTPIGENIIFPGPREPGV